MIYYLDKCNTTSAIFIYGTPQGTSLLILLTVYSSKELTPSSLSSISRTG